MTNNNKHALISLRCPNIRIIHIIKTAEEKSSTALGLDNYLNNCNNLPELNLRRLLI